MSICHNVNQWTITNLTTAIAKIISDISSKKWLKAAQIGIVLASPNIAILNHMAHSMPKKFKLKALSNIAEIVYRMV